MLLISFARAGWVWVLDRFVVWFGVSVYGGLFVGGFCVCYGWFGSGAVLICLGCMFGVLMWFGCCLLWVWLWHGFSPSGCFLLVLFDCVILVL